MSAEALADGKLRLRAATLVAALGLAALAAAPPAEARLRHAVQLPAESFDYVTWDPVLKRTPNRGRRRWGTTKLVETTQLVCCAAIATPTRMPRVS